MVINKSKMKCNKPWSRPDGPKKFVVKACGGSTETIYDALKHVDEKIAFAERMFWMILTGAVGLCFVYLR